MTWDSWISINSLDVVENLVALEGNDHAVVSLKGCEVLDRYHIQGVNIEISESRIIKQAGCRFLNPSLGPVFGPGPTVTAHKLFTATLGIPISTKNMPRVEGTEGFYISAGGDDKMVYLVTAWHVVLPLNRDTNIEWKHKNTGEPRYVILGNSVFNERPSAINVKVKTQQGAVGYIQSRIDLVVRRDDREAEKAREAVGTTSVPTAVTTLKDSAQCQKMVEDRPFF